MENNKKEIKDKKLWDTAGKLIATIMMFSYLVYVLNNAFHFIPAGNIWVDILINLVYYGPLALIVITTFEAVSLKSQIIKIAVIIIWIVVVLFSVSPDLFGIIKG